MEHKKTPDQLQQKENREGRQFTRTWTATLAGRSENKTRGSYDSIRGGQDFSVVADGVAHYSASKEMADRLTQGVEAIATGLAESQTPVSPQILEQYVIATINKTMVEQASHAHPNEQGGSTLTAVFLDAESGMGISVQQGDSAAMRIRGGHVKEITPDHSQVINRNVANAFEFQKKNPRPQFETFSVKAGDIVMNWTDGFEKYLLEKVGQESRAKYTQFWQGIFEEKRVIARQKLSKELGRISIQGEPELEALVDRYAAEKADIVLGVYLVSERAKADINEGKDPTKSIMDMVRVFAEQAARTSQDGYHDDVSFSIQKVGTKSKIKLRR